jgi:predicted DCC family thiol-disulfide oxidoreductase YuxK
VVSRRVLQPCQAKRGDVPAAIATEAPGADTLQKAADYFATDKRPIILFDGICNMCNGGVNFMIDWDKTGKHRFAALQSECGRTLLQRCGREPENLTSIVLVTPEKCHIRSDAILSIGRNLDMPMPILSYLAWPVPGFIRDTFYNFIATNRYNIAGKRAMRCGDTSFNDRFIM